MTVRGAGSLFATTDHCGRLEILDRGLDPSYCRLAIQSGYGRTFGFDRVVRPSLQRMKKVSLRVPINEYGEFDVDIQRELAREYEVMIEASMQPKLAWVVWKKLFHKWKSRILIW